MRSDMVKGTARGSRHAPSVQPDRDDNDFHQIDLKQEVRTRAAFATSLGECRVLRPGRRGRWCIDACFRHDRGDRVSSGQRHPRCGEAAR